MDEPDIRDAISDGNPEKLLLAGTNALLELASEDDVGQKEIILAELTVRWCLSRNVELGRELEGMLGETWKRIKEWRETGWEPDKRTGKRRLPEDGSWKNRMLPGFDGRLRSRLILLFDAVGFIPVYDESDRQGAAFIPFEFTKEEDEVGAFWKDGERIGEWDEDVCNALKGTDKRGIRLQVGIIPVTGSSLMLPVRLAAMRGAGLPLYDTLKVLATGKIVNGRLDDVAVKAKYDAMTLQFVDAVLFGPDPYCDIHDTERFVRLDVGEGVDETIAKIGETLLSEQWHDCIIMTAMDVAIESYYKEFANRQDVRNDMELFIPLDADKYVWEPRNAAMPEQDIVADEVVTGNVAIVGEAALGEEPVEGDDDREEDGGGEEHGGRKGSGGRGQGSVGRAHEVGTAKRPLERSHAEGEEQIYKASGCLSEFLRAERGGIVSGESGRGKSMSLKHFVLQFQGDDPTSRVLCIFLEMKHWGKITSLADYLTGETPDWEELEQKGRLWLAIDAIDECPADHRESAIVQIGKFLKVHSRVHFVISTRMAKELFSGHPVFKNAPEFRIRPMDEDHQKKLLERTDWFAKEGSNTVGRFLAKIRNEGVPDALVENPMMLRLLADINRKSPEEPLPQRSADVYRRITEIWYEREEKTRKDFYKPFEEELEKKLGAPWPEWGETRKRFGALAFMIQKGGKEFEGITFEEAEKTVGPALDRLCRAQLFVFRDGQGDANDKVWFRHKSFQEYFCAEYLVEYLAAIPPAQDAGLIPWGKHWGMVFAYAVRLFELEKQDIPPTFWLIAWYVHGWLAVALTGRAWAVPSSRKEYEKYYHGFVQIVQSKLPSRVFGLAICGNLGPDDIRQAMNDGFWYDRRDEVLRQMVEGTWRGRKNWERMEAAQTQLEGLKRKQAIQLARSWLFRNPREAFHAGAPHGWQRWLAEATPQSAQELEDAGICQCQDFAEKIPGWKGTASLHDACVLVERKWAVPGDFAEKKAEWTAVATPDMAQRMLMCGLAEERDFSGRIDSWLRHPQYAFVRTFFRAGVDEETKRKIADRMPAWRENASLESARDLIRDGRATAEDFAGKTAEWIAVWRPAGEEGGQGKMAEGDEEEDEHPGGRSFGRETYFRALAELAGEGAERAKNVVLEVERASAALKEGKKREDFADCIPKWVAGANIATARKMIRMGLVGKNDFRGKVSCWIATASPEMAVEMVKPSKFSDPLAAVEDFAQRAAAWKGFPLEPHATRLLASVLDNDAIAAAKSEWCATISPETLYDVACMGGVTWQKAEKLLGLWGREFFPARWISQKIISAARFASCYHDGQFVKGKIVSIDQFGVRVELREDVTGFLSRQNNDIGAAVVWGGMKIGDIIKVVIKKIDGEKRKIELGFRGM